MPEELRAYGPEQELVIGAATALLDPDLQEQFPAVVIEGAPGQGKSTLVQYLCQVYRLRLLKRDMSGVAEAHQSGADRLPFKVDLRDFAQWLKRENPLTPGEPFQEHWTTSLEGLIAAKIEHLSGGISFNVSDLAAVVGLSSALLVLDGLDEVPDIAIRRQVVDEATSAIARLSENSLSLQVVVTSRPAAFANSPGFSPRRFRYLELVSIGRELITEYSERWLRARRLQARAAADVRRILKTKLDQPHMRDLARNPMQLAILLSLINTRGASLPDKRTALYDAYVDTFFSREAEKSLVVREYRDLLVDIHRYVAWLLHVEAESRKSDGRITAERLKLVVADYLSHEGHDPDLAVELFEGMVERVVALVSRVQGTYEFEVQPLREYFVARHLYETAPHIPVGAVSEAGLPDRFETVIRNGYWLNVARFLAGCFSKGELASVVDALRGLKAEPAFHLTQYPGELARMFLADWVFASTPRLLPDVLDVFADALGLKLLRVDRPADRGEGDVSLPPRSGRELLFEKVLELLDGDVPMEFSSQLAQIARANADDADLKPRWWEFVATASGDKRTKWIDLGLRLGVLHRATADELDALLEDAPLELRRLAVLMRAGHVDYCEMSGERARAIVDAMLSGDRAAYSFFGERGRLSPLQALSLSLFPASLFRFGRSTPVLSSVRPGEPSVITDVRDVANSYLEMQGSLSHGWSSSLALWHRHVELGRDRFGECWAWLALANFVAGLAEDGVSANDAKDLFDRTTGVCLRARYARMRAGTRRWWERQLGEARSNADKEFAVLLCMTWTGRKTLAHLVPRVDPLVRTFPSAGYRKVYNALSEFGGPFYEAPWRGTSLDIDDIGEVHPRSAALLALRLKPEARAELHARFLQTYRGNDATLLRARSEWELPIAFMNDGGWDEMLRLVRRSYNANGFTRELDPRPAGRRRTLGMPEDVARAIVRDCVAYPTDLVRIAEARLRGIAMGEVTPVGEVAHRNHWFG